MSLKITGIGIVLMVEVQEEATYVRHHKKKIAFLFSAMRHHAETLRRAGWCVDYVTLDAPNNSGSFTGEVERAIVTCKPDKVLVTEPGEWRVRAAMETWESQFNVPVTILEDDRFIATHAEFQTWAEGRKQLRMEYFYRDMRRKTGLLMDGDQPAGGKWNYDSENRKPAKADLFMPTPLRQAPDEITVEVLDLVAQRFDNHFGDLTPFWFGVTTEQANAALDRFIETALPKFGDYQDAMLEGEKFLYHSLISFYINAGLLDPLEACRRVEAAYEAGAAPLNAAEGFIRQILGWREYMRGIYWAKMPEYAELNFFGHDRPLPGWFWTGDTRMACLRHAIGQTLEHAYAHHIQRLMVTGNFALLAGVDPDAVDAWYLGVYIDAVEWVEITNTRGMSQFADGGIVGTKPYVASANYMKKMGPYCAGCKYKASEKTGPDSCPFNSLYWHFYDRNRDLLAKNPRIGMAYRTWDKMAPEKRAAILETATHHLNNLESL